MAEFGTKPLISDGTAPPKKTSIPRHATFCAFNIGRSAQIDKNLRKEIEMTMQYKFFMIPIYDMETSENELNRFLASVDVVEVQTEFVARESGAYWALAVEYLKPDDEA